MRAIGIVRQSRSREDSLSPVEQRERIEAICGREGLELLTVHEELDVSGGTPLADRDGLRAAVEAVERGAAQVVVVAYFDRLFRSLTVQAEVVKRIEQAGGRILAADIGEVSGATPAQWISGTMLGVVSEYYRRSVGERVGEAKVRAVARGVLPYPNVPLGYVRQADKTLAPSEDAEAVRDAFALRAKGATIREVRELLVERGIERPYRSVQSMFRSRVYLGEIRFGKLANRTAHEPLIDRRTWDACQGVGRATSPATRRLLSGLGVLRCGTCGGPLTVNRQEAYTFYRCGAPTGDCPKRVAISAPKVEAVVRDAVQDLLRDVTGRASAVGEARAAVAELDAAQAKLDTAIRILADMTDEPAAIANLRELREKRDAARENAEHLGSLVSAFTVTADDWDDLSLDGRRALVRATLERVAVGPGRGADRVSIHPVSE